MHREGFTLVELLTALALVTVLLSIGLPAFGRLIDNQRMDIGSEQLARSIQQTREEAVRRNEAVTMAPIGGDWNAGWQVFIDRNSNATFDQGDQLLGQDIAASVRHIHGTGALARYLRYNALGESELVNGGFLAGTLRLCPQQQNGDARLLIINRVGRLRMDREQTQERYCSAPSAQ